MDSACAESLHIHPLYVRRGSQCISSPSLSKGSAKISISDRGPRLGHLFLFFSFLLLQTPTSSSPREKSEEIHAVTMKSIRVVLLLVLMGSATPESTYGTVPPQITGTASTTNAPTATTAAASTTQASSQQVVTTHKMTQQTIAAAISQTMTTVGKPNQELNTTTSSNQANNSDLTSSSPGPKSSSKPSVTRTTQANETAQNTQHRSSNKPPEEKRQANEAAQNTHESSERQDNKPPEEKHHETAPRVGSDKRLWWILLPAVVVVGVAALFYKFKTKKVHDHTETIDTGAENASFQSRPESAKDGVMLLGVKSSGGEENAAR
ncbi:uncharacterized protein LOC105936133 isoform X2 [Fundulus heteroclitus]|uniref:uncharacterized protein LOC105936133 isoform X2 n=1 Tax=Fundulus heteroclitus TaxID=8078 RepID=UPI00165C93F3|nr:uncharacterized protein LOC105936133 isoform X2 [Fundulus heteroclitus]